MKKLFLPLVAVMMIPVTYSCSSSRLANYTLTEADAAMAIREIFRLGAEDGSLQSNFTRDRILTTIFPESVAKTLNTLNQFGITSEIDRFTTTLSTAATESVNRSVPIFVNSLTGLRLADAMRLVKAGGTAATDYLRASSGDSIRRALIPVMQQAINEYKLTQQWDNIIKPVKDASNGRLNLDLANLMAASVTQAMFKKIEEKEKQVREDESFRSTALLKKVFGRSWN